LNLRKGTSHTSGGEPGGNGGSLSKSTPSNWGGGGCEGAGPLGNGGEFPEPSFFCKLFAVSNVPTRITKTIFSTLYCTILLYNLPPWTNDL